MDENTLFQSGQNPQNNTNNQPIFTGNSASSQQQSPQNTTQVNPFQAFQPPIQNVPPPVQPTQQTFSQTQNSVSQPIQNSQPAQPVQESFGEAQDLRSTQNPVSSQSVNTPEQSSKTEDFQEPPIDTASESISIPQGQNIKQNEFAEAPIIEDRGGFHIPKIVKIIGAIFIALIVLIIVLAFFSRGKNTTSGKITLTYWGLWEDKNTVDPIISDFERQNPNITVNYIQEDPKQYSQRLLTRIKNGNGPDIFRYHNSWMPMLSQVLLPIPTSVISSSDFQKDYYNFEKEDLVKNGAIYGIPLGIDTLELFTNNDIFNKAGVSVPTTWDYFITAAKGLTVKDADGKIKTAGAALGTFDNVTHAPDIVSLLFAQNGVNLQKFSSSQNAADALTFYTSFAKGQSNVWDDTLDPSLTMFATGRLAMYFGYSWDILTIEAANPSLKFTVSSVPNLPGQSTTIASYWVEGVSNASTHQKEALLFMQFLAKKETQQELFTEESKTRQFGELYARSDLGDLLKSNSLIYPFIQGAKDAVSTPFDGETYDTGIDAQMNGYLGNAVNSVLQSTSAQSAVDTLTKGVSQVLDQYGQKQTP